MTFLSIKLAISHVTKFYRFNPLRQPVNKRMIPISMRNALVLTALLMGSIATSAAPPNIVFIFSDDHAYQAVSAYGDGLNHTPNIDRLGTEGMLFNRCYVTKSICGPARAVVQTGKYSHLNGFYSNDNRFDGTQQTFPKLLKKTGYQFALLPRGNDLRLKFVAISGI